MAVGSPTNVEFHEVASLPALTIPADKDVYFGPGIRKTPGSEKKDVLGARVLWVDVDDMNFPQSTLPPTMLVFSGHGWHMYWALTEPVLELDALEALNKTVTDDVPTADRACWNGNRVLRIPGTTNHKFPEVAQVELRAYRPSLIYSCDDFIAVSKLQATTRHKIRTGDSRGYRSRSERDWAILSDLVACGATDGLIQTIYAHQPCGNKAKENEHYLPHTLETIRAKQPIQADTGKIDIQVGSDGFYVKGRKGLQRISTYVIKPKILLDGAKFGAQDAIVTDVDAEGFTWENVPFSRTAFQSVSKMDAETPVVAWQWLGKDDDVRRLLPFLLEQLKAQGLPRVAATNTLGLHKIGEQWLFLGDMQALSARELWKTYEGPICWLPSRKEHPKMALDIVPENLERIAQLVPKTNAPGVIWPMVGWYTATCLKPWLEERHYRYPILNVAGTKGSGKTTLIQRIFMPMMGQLDPRSYDANTTRFVILTLLGSSNAVPIAFSEFRYEAAEKFIRFILLGYDTGHDPRGKGDQTTVDYPLSAPFSVDGEDLIEDPAGRERIVVAQLHPDTVAEGSEAYAAFNEVRDLIKPGIAGHIIQYILKNLADGKLEDILQEARDQIFQAFPGRLPDRVRNNHVVAYFGVKLWCGAMQVDEPGPEVMMNSITSVFDITSGRGRTLADAMAEDVVNAVASGTVLLNYVYDDSTNVMWFQLAPVHTWWITSRRRQGRGALERDAIRVQLREAPYMVPPQVVHDAWMYGIDLTKAVEAGLDIPSKLSDATFVMRL